MFGTTPMLTGLIAPFLEEDDDGGADLFFFCF
jgi:hypothetical protein